MKTFSFFALSAFAAGGVLAFAIHSTALVMEAPQGIPRLLANTVAPGHFTSVSPAAAGWSEEAAAEVAARHSGKATVTLLLREPVVVLSGRGSTATELPSGTSVRLLATHGAFLLVRHAGEILTVPRTAVVTGVLGSN